MEESSAAAVRHHEPSSHREFAVPSLLVRKEYHDGNGVAQREHSVVEVKTHQTFEKGKPKKDGLSDLRMGTTDRAYNCATCGCNPQDCPGHFGHIELARPQYHIGYLPVLVKMLKCIGFYTSQLVLDPEGVRFAATQHVRNREARFKAVVALCDRDKVKCHVTGRTQPKFRVEGGCVVVDYGPPREDGGLDGRHPLPASKALQVLRRVRDEDYEKIGIDARRARGDWMVLSVMPVCPPCIRPSVADNASRSDDDLTTKLADIIKSNVKLRDNMKNGSPESLVREFEQLLQFHCSTFIDNSKPGQQVAAKRNGTPLTAVSQRLKGKEGRVRQNLNGKRVDFSARTVIGGDANIDVDELGVPISIARSLTFPETVTPLNKARLEAYVAAGPHPDRIDVTGANYIVRPDGRIDLRMRVKVCPPRSSCDSPFCPPASSA